MDSIVQRKSNNWRNWVGTSIFCLLVTLLTYSVWGGQFYIHIVISFGFGYSALIFSWLIDKFIPTLPKMLEIALSLMFSTVFGVINASYWSQNFFGVNDLLPIGIMGMFFGAICFYYFYSRELQAIAEREIETIRREKIEQDRALLLSQLKQMQSQMEPHFLFNTLANISALMNHDVDKAQQMLDLLTALLRSSLKNAREMENYVQDEVALLDAYLGIQALRLGDRLRYQIEVDPQLNTFSLPPMMIQPLVENAIVHGIEPKREGGEVRVVISQVQTQFYVEVSDTGIGLAGVSEHQGSGVGLSNLRERVGLLFGPSGRVMITENRSGGVTVKLSWPLAARSPQSNPSNFEPTDEAIAVVDARS